MYTLIQETSYNTWTVLIAAVGTAITFLLIKHIPQRSYRYLKGLRIIQQSELDKLYQTIAGLESTIALHLSAPIKEEKDGQLSFLQMVGESQRMIKLPQDRQVVYSSVAGNDVPVYIKDNGHYKKTYTLPNCYPVKVLSTDKGYSLIANPFKDGKDLPPLYVLESNIQLEKGFQVWNAKDWERAKAGEQLVKRDKKRMWVEEVLKGDQIIKAYRWERA